MKAHDHTLQPGAAPATGPGEPVTKWEQRWHPLRREWVVVAAHRDNRPWSGHTLDASPAAPPKHDPACHLCPRGHRVSGVINPDYGGVFVFDNDHPCVGDDAPDLDSNADAHSDNPYRRSRATGIARVACYHPRHDLALGQLPLPGVVALLRCWQDQYRELAARPGVNHVLIFENRGQAVGVSNPHPHCQIYATNFVFPTIEREAAYAAEHHAQTGRTLLGDMIDHEVSSGKRIVAERESAIAFVPFCARFAYEVFVAPRRPVANIAELNEAELTGFAAALREVVARYDNLWRMPMPYVLALHQAPTDGGAHPGFHFHAELHPPLRRPNLLKHLAGPELGGGGFLADTWPEDKAAELRSTSDTHHLGTDNNGGDHD